MVPPCGETAGDLIPREPGKLSRRMQAALVVESDPAQLRFLRQKLRILLKKEGVPEKDCQEVLVAVGEGCTNAIRHAYSGESGHPIRVTVARRGEKLILKIRDFGRKINLAKIKTPELPPKKGGGLGVYFMKKFMDEMAYRTGHRQGNELILVKRVGGTA